MDGAIQVWALRQNNETLPQNIQKQATRKLYNTNIKEKSIESLFENYTKILDKFEPDQRYNLFYTVQECNQAQSERTLVKTDTIPIDVDQIDPFSTKETAECIIRALKPYGITWENTGIVSSGNGLHFLIKTKTLFTKDNFTQYKKAYQGLITYLTTKLQDESFFGRIDNIWKEGQLLRVPGTLNKKPNKETRKCEPLNKTISQQDFDLRHFEKYAKEEVYQDNLPEILHKTLTYGTIETVESNCAFLKHAKENAVTLNEPEWYAAINVYAFMDGGKEKIHEISKPHPSYTKKETDNKIKNVLQKTKGPRTCRSIQELTYNEHCNGCKYKEQITTPAQITGKKIYPHEDVGFCKINDRTQKLTPFYNEMVDKLVDVFNLIYVDGLDEFWEYRTNQYQKITETKLRTEISHLSRRQYLAPNMTETIAQLRSLKHIHRDIEWIKKSTENKLNLKNGILNFDTLEIESHSPEVAFSSALSYDFNPSATCPKFEKFMLDISCNDTDWIAVMQEWLGYILVPSFPHASKCLWFYGPTSSNGKNTMAKLIKSLMPEKDTTNIRVETLSDPTYIVDMIGAKLNIADESNKVRSRANDKMDLASTLNMLVTGEEIKIRGSYGKKALSLLNWARLLFMSNDIPELDSVKGFDRRVMYVPFDAHFTEQNKDIYILDKLKEERSGILNFAIEGYQRLKKNNFKFSQAERISTLTEEKIKKKDPYFEWVHDNFEFHDGARLEKDKIRDKHRKDMQIIGEVPLSDKRLFGQVFKQAFNLSDKDLNQKVNEGIERIRCIRNVAFKSQLGD